LIAEKNASLKGTLRRGPLQLGPYPSRPLELFMGFMYGGRAMHRIAYLIWILCSFSYSESYHNTRPWVTDMNTFPPLAINRNRDRQPKTWITISAAPYCRPKASLCVSPMLDIAIDLLPRRRPSERRPSYVGAPAAVDFQNQQQQDAS
jgi:hypothetical protein